MLKENSAMGWWIVEKASEELLQGDIPYDIMMEAFQKIAEEYQQDWNRKPTLAELVHIIETVLATGSDNYFSNEEVEIVNLTIKTRKRRKYQSFQVGDFFAIPIEGGRYAFGRILSDLKADKLGMLVGIYDRTSKKMLNPIQLKGKKFMFTPFYCQDNGWKTRAWRIIGNISVGPDEFVYPKHKEGFEGFGWWIIDKDRKYEATEEEVRNLEYAELWSAKAIEKRILKYLEAKASEDVDR